MPDAICKDCESAMQLRWWGGYHANCCGCMARAAARTLAAFNAMHPCGTGDKDEFRALIVRMVSGVEYEDARRMVWEWWRRDHGAAGRNSEVDGGKETSSS